MKPTEEEDERLNSVLKSSVAFHFLKKKDEKYMFTASNEVFTASLEKNSFPVVNQPNPVCVLTFTFHKVDL